MYTITDTHSTFLQEYLLFLLFVCVENSIHQMFISVIVTVGVHLPSSQVLSQISIDRYLLLNGSFVLKVDFIIKGFFVAVFPI